MQVSTWLSNIAFHLWLIWMQTLVAIRIMPDIVSKLLRFAIWSSCAVRFESEQTPFPWTGRCVRSGALYKIRFGTGCFVSMSYFCSETNEWSKDLVKRRALLWSATTSRHSHRKLHWEWLHRHSHRKFRKKKKIKKTSYPLLPKIFKALNVFDSRTESVSQEWLQVFLKRASRCPQWLQPLWNALCLCSPVRPPIGTQAVLERGPKSSAIDLAVKPRRPLAGSIHGSASSVQMSSASANELCYLILDARFSELLLDKPGAHSRWNNLHCEQKNKEPLQIWDLLIHFGFGCETFLS